MGTFLIAERMIGSLFSLILNSCSVVSYVLLAGCQTDHIPFCLEWDLEKPRAVKGLDPFTQPPHRQPGLPVGMRAALKISLVEKWYLSSCKGSYYHTYTFTLPREYLGVVYSR